MEPISGNCPQVRYLEPVPFEHDGNRFVHLRDPFHYAPDALSVSLPAFVLITMMDGAATVGDIAARFNSTYNAKIKVEEVTALVMDLDRSFLLANGNFLEHRKRVMDGFAREPLRRAALAGSGYPADGLALSALLDGYLAGKPDGPAPYAVISPHIDLKAGGPTFGAAFAPLASSAADTFVILGIGHSLEGDFFACIDKDFETPLGVSAVDRPFLSALEKDFGEPIFGQMYAHKYEHSVEFQALFLQKLFSGRPYTIVPVLLSFPEVIGELDDPKFNATRVERFISALKKGMDRLGPRGCLIAGVDLSHVGRRFGREEGVTPELLKEVEADDLAALTFLGAGDKKGFVEHLKKVNPKNSVCGFPALYALFDLLEGRAGTLLEYRQNVEGENDSAVSFAAMTFK